MLSPDPVRVLWQGFLDAEGSHRDYFARVKGHISTVVGSNVSIDMRGIRPPVSEIDRLTELRCAIVSLRNVIEAEREGYDVVVISHFQEPLLAEMRASVGIPVVGLGEAALLFACTVGQRIGLVTIDRRFVSWHQEQVARHGLEQRVVGVESLNVSPAEFSSLLEPGTRQNDGFVEHFVRTAQPLLDAGAEVIVPAGALPSMALAGRAGLQVDGAPVLDIVRIAILEAVRSVSIRRCTGLRTSDRGGLARPSREVIADFLAQTGGASHGELEA